MAARYFYSDEIFYQSINSVEKLLEYYEPDEVHAIIAQMASLVIQKRTWEGVDKDKANEDFNKALEASWWRCARAHCQFGNMFDMWEWESTKKLIEGKSFADIEIE